MNEAEDPVVQQWTDTGLRADLLQQYGCGPIRFSGTDDALYERHLLFDDVVAPDALPGLASASRRLPALSGMSFRSVGSAPKPLMKAQTRSAYTTCPWNFSSDSR